MPAVEQEVKGGEVQAVAAVAAPKRGRHGRSVSEMPPAVSRTSMFGRFFTRSTQEDVATDGAEPASKGEGKSRHKPHHSRTGSDPAKKSKSRSGTPQRPGRASLEYRALREEVADAAQVFAQVSDMQGVVLMRAPDEKRGVPGDGRFPRSVSTPDIAGMGARPQPVMRASRMSVGAGSVAGTGGTQSPRQSESQAAAVAGRSSPQQEPSRGDEAQDRGGAAVPGNDDGAAEKTKTTEDGAEQETRTSATVPGAAAAATGGVAEQQQQPDGPQAAAAAAVPDAATVNALGSTGSTSGNPGNTYVTIIHEELEGDDFYEVRSHHCNAPG